MKAAKLQTALDKLVSDRPDFLEVYDRWVAPIYKYFLSRVGEEALAEDLTSQLFLKAYQAYPGFEQRGSVAAWLFTIARNLAMDHFRASQRKNLYLDQEFRQLQTDQDTVKNRESLILLQTALMELDSQDQELILLRYLNQLSFAEIGSIIGVSEQAAKKRVYRLLSQLRSRMGAENA